MRFALELWTADANEAVAVAGQAEAAGFDALYVGESPTARHAETWATLGAIAVSTRTLRCGPVITNLLPDYRSDLLVARHAATVAQLSAGRLDFRTGAGASATYARPWWEPAGVRYPDHATRIRRLEESLTRLRRWWHGRPATVPGGSEVALGLDHPPIPITIAASGPSAMAVASRHGDRWETSWCTPAQWAARPKPDRAMPSSVEVDAFVAPDESALRALLTRVRHDRRTEDVDRILDRALVGTPHQVAPVVARYAAVGVDQLLLVPHDPTDPATLAALAAIPRPPRPTLPRRRPGPGSVGVPSSTRKNP